MRGGRGGLVRRVRFGVSGEAAVEKLCDDLPKSPGHTLIGGDAGIATKEQCAQATLERAFLGRRRIHEKSRWVPHSWLWGGKRAARRAATISVWPTKQVPMPFMT